MRRVLAIAAALFGVAAQAQEQQNLGRANTIWVAPLVAQTGFIDLTWEHRTSEAWTLGLGTLLRPLYFWQTSPNATQSQTFNATHVGVSLSMAYYPNRKDWGGAFVRPRIAAGVTSMGSGVSGAQDGNSQTALAFTAAVLGGFTWISPVGLSLQFELGLLVGSSSSDDGMISAYALRAIGLPFPPFTGNIGGGSGSMTWFAPEANLLIGWSF